MKKENLYMISVIVSSSFCSLSPDRLRLSFVTRSSSASMLIPSAGFFSHCSTVHQLARLQLHFFSSSHQLASVNGNTQNLGGAVFQYTPPGAQSTFAPGLSRPRGLAIYHGNLYVATNTLDPVTGNLQSSIIKVSASGVQTLFATFSNVNFSAEGLAIDRAGNVFVVAFDQTSPAFASTIFKFTPDGAESTFGSLPRQGFGLAFDAAGNLFA